MDNTSLRKKLESIKGYLPSQYVDTIFDELNRVNGYSDESRSRKQRLELIANLPWTEDTSQFLSNTTIQNMSEILDEEHYGMFSVKDRFFGYLFLACYIIIKYHHLHPYYCMALQVWEKHPLFPL